MLVYLSIFWWSLRLFLICWKFWDTPEKTAAREISKENPSFRRKLSDLPPIVREILWVHHTSLLRQLGSWRERSGEGNVFRDFSIYQAALPPLITSWKVWRESNCCVGSQGSVSPRKKAEGTLGWCRYLPPQPSCSVKGSVVSQGQHDLRDRKSCHLNSWGASQVFKGSLVVWDELAEASGFGV